MLSTDEKMQALIIPLRQQNLVLPQSALVEVLPMPEIQPVAQSEAWLAGTIEWRGRAIPLVSIERYCGWVGLDQTRARRVAVLNGIGSEVPHYAIEIQSVPHPIRLGRNDLVSVEGERRCELVAGHVQALGVWAVLMRLDILEKVVAKNLKD